MALSVWSDWHRPGGLGTDRAETWSLLALRGWSQRASHALCGLYWINKVSMTSVVSAQGGPPVTLSLSLSDAGSGRSSCHTLSLSDAGSGRSSFNSMREGIAAPG